MRLFRWLVVASTPAFLQAQESAVKPPVDFSSVVFGNYQMRTDSLARAANGGKPANKFDIARAYLTFRMPVGERTSVRITTDIFQQSGAAAAYYGGWTVRLKYGILQHDLTKNLFGVKDMAAVARLGMLHTVVIEHVESHWPRYLGNSALEMAGFFSSADVGAATQVTLPGRKGEVYATITNGVGYTQSENDRFKDFAARLSYTPFGSDSGFFRSFVITPWYYKGWNASAFVAPPNSISDGLQKDRRGVFVGLRERRLTFGAEIAQRVEEVETGPAAARTITDRTSQLVSGFALVRPLEWLDAKRRSPLSFVARHDRFKLDQSAAASPTNPANTFTVLGVSWDLSSRTTLTLDYQGLERQAGSTINPTRTWFLHWQASF